MPDIALIQGAITGLKTAGDIAKSFLELKSISDIQGKVIELQSAILSAQSSALAAQGEQSLMVQRIRDLEEEVADAKAWKETEQRYQLDEIGKGFFAFSLKEESKGAEPFHKICANCYQKRKKSILQMQPQTALGDRYYCHECKFEFFIIQLLFVSSLPPSS